jgi:hypothetical protein
MVHSRAFRIEHHTFRAEVQREGEPLASTSGVLCETLEDAWRWSEQVVHVRYPHDCREMDCLPVRDAAG